MWGGNENIIKMPRSLGESENSPYLCSEFSLFGVRKRIEFLK